MGEFGLEIVIGIVAFLALVFGLKAGRSDGGKSVLKKAKDIFSDEQEEVMADAREQMEQRLREVDSRLAHARSLPLADRVRLIRERADILRRKRQLKVDGK
jgi:hypothetical protein